MNKTQIAILLAGLATAITGYTYAQTPSESHQSIEHAREKAAAAAVYAGQDDLHREENHDERTTHNAGAKHGHEEHANGQHDDGDADEHGLQEQGDKQHIDHEGEAGHEESASASLKPVQMTLAGIRVEPLMAKRVDYQLYAPGEILSNGYTSYRVSPRVASVVLRRHVALGDHVKQGQPLVTLFSESLAQAQADYLTAWPEWQRVQQLGRKTIGEQRYISARANLQAARATLLAYGLLSGDLELLVSQQSRALGEYTLRAEIDGAVLADDFEQGQRIEAGGGLIMLADEKQLWVEAHLPANSTLTMEAGTVAEVVTGDVRVKARVTQEAHTIDPVTRTRTVRLLLDNPEHRFHPGQFAEVFFRFRTQQPVLAVSESALMRGVDGDWIVFVEGHPGEFLPVEVELGQALGSLREITGVEPGVRIVTLGAFFVASQIAKGGFDPHNH